MPGAGWPGDRAGRRPGAGLPLAAMHADDNAMLFRKPPTILDVAVEAGVSKSTVSNVVRGATGVSEATRRRVRDAINSLGYRPNVIARQLVKRRTQILGVVVSALVNPLFAAMLKKLKRHDPSRRNTSEERS